MHLRGNQWVLTRAAIADFFASLAEKGRAAATIVRIAIVAINFTLSLMVNTIRIPCKFFEE